MAGNCLGPDLPNYWWRDGAILRAEVEAHGSQRSTAIVHHVDQSTISKWWHRLELGDSYVWDGRPMAEGTNVGSLPQRDWLLSALKVLGDKASVEEIADHADVSPKRVRDAAKELGLAGFRVEASHSHVVLHRVPPAKENLHPSLFDGETVRVGVVSDTHLGSKEEALPELELAYDIFEREGITQVWHTGDVGCGVEVFGPKQHSEANVHTLDEQRDYVVKNYPHRKGIVTRAIGGNHDLEGLAGRAGWDLVAAVANEREDIENLGAFEAWVETLPGTGRWIHLLHGKGGMSYAWSYKAQKHADSYPSGRKPSVLIIGHWHVRGNIRARDIEILWPACFEWQSPFMARLGLHPSVGFHILEMTVGEDGSVVRWRPEWFPYYQGREAT